MSKPRVFTVTLAVVALFTLASSVRADSVHLPRGLEKLKAIESESLSVPDIIRGEVGYLFTEHFADNNGRHLGFSVAAFNNGMKFGLTNLGRKSAVSQNPEPTAMLLLGTGLAASAAFARRMRKRRS